MKVQVYSVYDVKTEVFSQPIFLLNKAVALRSWHQAAHDKEQQIGQSPADFTLFQVAEWDDTKGEFRNLEAKISLGTALEQLNKEG